MNAIERILMETGGEKTAYRILLNSSKENSSIILIYDLRHILCWRVI